jgi:hypothetical protein
MGALLWLAVLLCASSTARAVGVAKSVHVSVRAKWEGTSLLLEAGLDFDQPSVCISGGMQACECALSLISILIMLVCLHGCVRAGSCWQRRGMICTGGS